GFAKVKEEEAPSFNEKTQKLNQVQNYDEKSNLYIISYEIKEKKELASRDVVSRRMMEHIRKGKGVKSPYGDHLWLDISILGRA
ncbi:hypothetical protein VWN94_10715, partial [Campylobacter coli]|uniref:hypothetical protein n=1 Tax=Campylobacter coli TaxID=195 RepID=UPI002E37F6C9